MANILAKYATANVDSGLIALYSKVTSAGASAIVTQDSHKMTISRTGVGLYKATLAGPFNSLFYFGGTMQKATLSGITFEVVSVALLNSETDPSFTFRSLNTAGAEADMAAADLVMFCAILRNSAQFRKGG